jgi:hypothetical protein
MSKKLTTIQIQLAVNSTSEQSEEYGNVLCQVRGVAKELAVDMKSFKLDLGAFGGEIPQQYDGLSVELTIDPDEDVETDTYMIPAAFKVLEISEEAYRPTSRKVDMADYLASLGIK